MWYFVFILNIIIVIFLFELVGVIDGEGLVGKVVVCRRVIVLRIWWNDVVGKNLLLWWSYLVIFILLKMIYVVCMCDRKGYFGWCNGIYECCFFIVWKKNYIGLVEGIKIL